MLDNFNWLFLFGVGLVAGFVNVMAGGGSTLTMPMLIFLGLDGATANGTNRIAIFIQNISATSSFHHHRPESLKTALWYSLWTLPGAVIGAMVAVNVKDELFQKILAVVIIGVMISLLIPQKSTGSSVDKSSRLIYPALVGIGFYGGFIQAGVGFFFMAAFLHILHLDLVTVNRYKVIIILLYTIPAVAIFVLAGKVHLLSALVLAAGNSLGAWWSAKLSIKKGEKVVRGVLVVVVCYMALKLLNIV